MTTHPKITTHHLQRLAYIYIRQSTLQQVSDHLESQDLQYQLTQRAEQLGWPAPRIRIFDQDLGKSAIHSQERAGFQELVADMALDKTGILLVTDVSRLARNCADWYQLLDLAALHDVLVCDASGVYNPRIYDDRLLLGLKGAFSEAQWYTMRQQLHAARLNKARRGELAMRLPVGYERLPNGQVVFCPDQQVQSAVRLVFRLFRSLGSVNALLRHLVGQAIPMPVQSKNLLGQPVILWQPPRYHTLYQILKLPAYAGAYTYGRRQRELIPGAGRSAPGPALPPDAWEVLLQDAWPGYISWADYLENQQILAQNRQDTPFAQAVSLPQGAPGLGRALLQGLVFCGRCGRPLLVRYREKPAYVCEADTRQRGQPRCACFPHDHVDQAVAAAFLEAVQPGRVEVALAAMHELAEERQALVRQAEQQRERVRYEAALARTRYEQVDPAMRLVAAELERAWEEKLAALDQAETRHAALLAGPAAPLAEADMLRLHALAEELPALWRAPATTNAQRKQLLRTLIQDVTLERVDSETVDGASVDGASVAGESVAGAAVTRIRIRWQGGACSEHFAARPTPGHPSDPGMMERIRELARTLTDDKIADVLNREGRVSFWQVKKLPNYQPGQPVDYWTRERVHHLRNKHKIPTGSPLQTKQSGPRADGLISAKEAARQLGVSPTTLLDWFRRGLIPGHQIHPVSPIWIALNDANRHRFDGSLERPAPDMLPLAEASARLGLSPEEVTRHLRAGLLESWRLLISIRYWWYVRPVVSPEISPVPAEPVGL